MRRFRVLATEATEIRSSRPLERLTGAVMVGYMLAVAVQVATRTASNTGQASFAESLQMVAANQGLYLTSLSAGLASSVLLIITAAGLYLLLRAYHPYLALVGSFFLLSAALTWIVSSVSGLALVQLSREFVAASGGAAETAAGSARAAELIRETAGRAGFTLAALGVLALGLLVAWRRALPRWLGGLGMVVGILMLFIWYDSAAALHRIGGTGYLLWWLAAGGWLLLRGLSERTTESG